MLEVITFFVFCIGLYAVGKFAVDFVCGFINAWRKEKEQEKIDEQKTESSMSISSEDDEPDDPDDSIIDGGGSKCQK